jgi:hypothetical protein
VACMGHRRIIFLMGMLMPGMIVMIVVLRFHINLPVFKEEVSSEYSYAVTGQGTNTITLFISESPTSYTTIILAFFYRLQNIRIAIVS